MLDGAIVDGAIVDCIVHCSPLNSLFNSGGIVFVASLKERNFNILLLLFLFCRCFICWQ